MNRFKRIAAGVVVVGLVACSALHAEDWNQFHGPNRDNLSKETGLLKEWPKDGPPLAWKVKGVGGGFSAPSIAKGKIFLAGDEGGDAYVFALNEADGKQVWKSKIGKPGGGGGHPGPRATPTVDGDTVYMIGQYGDVVAYAATDGKEIWRTNLNSDFGGKMMSGWGNSESLLIEGDVVLCTPGGKDGTLLALDKKTGKKVWRSTELGDSAAYMSPVVAEICGVRQAVVYTDQSVAGIDLKSGQVLWKAGRPGQVAVIPTPIVHNNCVFVASGYGVGCDLFKIEKQGGKFSATKAYSNKNMINHHGGVIRVGELLYGYSDKGGGRRPRPGQPAPPAQPAAATSGWTCMEMATGNVKYAEANGIAGINKGTISFADGLLYIRDESSGQIGLVEAAADGFKVKGTFQQPDRSDKKAWPHLVFANGKLYVRDQDVLLCYDVKGK